jgi:hypothetical protein
LKDKKMPDNQPLRSKLFFLDTQTYMARNFQFDYGVLERLQSHLEEDDCHLLITDVNVREVRRHLKRKAAEAVTAINKAKKEAMILRNTPALPWHGIFDSVSAQQISDSLEEKFNAFLNNNRVEVVATKNVDIDAVFDAYFNALPPFATSGKKAEFPDAFVLHAVNSISKQRGYKLYVVSEDRDVKSFCEANENLISLSRLEELLELVLKNSERLAEPAKFAEEIFAEFEGIIKQNIQEQLDGAEFELDDEFPEAEVSDIEVEGIEYLSKNLTDVSKEYATFELMVRVSVIVDMSLPDYDRSPWDSEDKFYPFVFHNKLVRRYIHTAPITVEISFDDGVAANAALAWVETDEIVDLSSARIEQISFKEMDFGDDEEYGH